MIELTTLIEVTPKEVNDVLLGRVSKAADKGYNRGLSEASNVFSNLIGRLPHDASPEKINETYRMALEAIETLYKEVKE